MVNPIIKNKVRVLRPTELETLRKILKPDKLAQLDGLTITGMRYIEAQHFQQHPEWYDGHFINLPKDASRKVKAKWTERSIKLPNNGDFIIPAFLKAPSLPTRQSWDEWIKVQAASAGIGPQGLCAKTTRKTWESWLVYYYPSYQTHIAIQQGHNDMTQMKHYLNMPFIDEDKKGMEKWVAGIW